MHDRYNTETRQSSWEMPEVYKTAIAQTGLPPKPPYVNAAVVYLALTSTRPQQYVTGGFPALTQGNDAGDRGADRPSGFGNEPNGVRAPTFQKSSDPEYNSYEEAEAAFMKLLKRVNVQPDWTWEQAMRATIKDAQFRAVKDPKDRRAAFDKYVADVRLQERERERERLAKLRADFAAMLRSHPEIRPHTRWRTARPILERETIFRSTDDDAERRQLFAEYVAQLQKAHAEREGAARRAALDELVAILRGLELEPYTRWADAHARIRAHERFAADAKFQTLTNSDVLTAFENHIKALERTFNDERQREKALRARREREARDAFADLLAELRAAGKLKAGTTWNDVFPTLEADPRYTNLLGQAGSGPLELFRDALEEAERALRASRNTVYDVLEDRRFEVTPRTTLAEFEAVMAADRRTAALPRDARELLFARLRDKVARRAHDDEHAAERARRRAADALRARLRRLEAPPLRPDDDWAAVRRRVEHTDEFRALPDEDLRRQAFDKVIRRLKDKDDDAPSRARPARGADRDRAPASTDGRRGTARRTPEKEPDAYEADRRKAVADRERQYRRGGPDALSPPPPRRRSTERADRRGEGGRLSAGFERERRDADRERGHRSRAGGGRDELDYGNGGGRRRTRDMSEGAESVGSRKRARKGERSRERERERERERKEREAAAKKAAEEAYESGSEEGEMVES